MSRRRSGGSKLGRDRHLYECFGRGDEEAREDCPCPPDCRRLCAEEVFVEHNAPRVLRGQGSYRPFTPIPNGLLGAWPLLVRPGARLAYLGLISLAWDSRWIVERTEVVAERLGVRPKVLNSYCKELEDQGLLVRIPLRDISVDSKSNHHAILLRDLPDWVPGYLSDEKIEEIEGGAGGSDEDDPSDPSWDDEDEADDGDEEADDEEDENGEARW